MAGFGRGIGLVRLLSVVSAEDAGWFLDILESSTWG